MFVSQPDELQNPTFLIIMKKINALLLSAAATLAAPAFAQKAPAPVLPLPEAKQVEWQKMETYAFIHFGLNTFNDREWGYGDSDPKTFNPTRLDANQWARTLKAAGMKGVILTAKHHDGFCLWPFKGTDYNITQTPYKNGKGDVVRELSDACRKYGLKFAVYLSPWDRHHAEYGRPAYLPYFYAQLRDLLTNYGDMYEVWFDGANGGDGWYGGAKESRTIDRKNYYNYPRIYEMLGSIAPNAIVFSDGGPGCRWVGNERGFAGATNWSFLRRGEVFPGYPRHYELQYGHADGNQWVPAECDVSIRPGWFYHPEQDDQVKTPEQLLDLYYRSVGHNGTLLLNFPVDREGLIHPIDSTNAVRFRELLEQELKHNLVKGMKAEVSSVRGKKFAARNMTDGKYDSYWATPDGTSTGNFTFRFKKPQRMNRMMLQEYIPLGQRVKAFTVEWLDENGTWQTVNMNEETTTIGYKRLLRFETVTSTAIRVRITDARGPLCINEVGIYDAGRNADISYAENPTRLQSVPFTLNGIDKEEAAKATDHNDHTTLFVHSDRVVIDLGQVRMVSSFHFLPDQGEPNRGLVSNYEICVGNDPDNLTQVVKAGELSNIKNNPILQSIYFTPTLTRYISFRATRMINEGEPMGFAEMAVK